MSWQRLLGELYNKNSAKFKKTPPFTKFKEQNISSLLTGISKHAGSEHYEMKEEIKNEIVFRGWNDCKSGLQKRTAKDC